jgi:protein SCO1/2
MVLTNIASALDGVGPLADSLQPIFIIVDPSRDTAGAMLEYARAIHPSLLGCTGMEVQVVVTAKVLCKTLKG